MTSAVEVSTQAVSPLSIGCPVKITRVPFRIHSIPGGRRRPTTEG
jgi:hypothetical protein